MRKVFVAIRRDDSAAFLAAMLERVESEVGDVRGFIMTRDCKDAARIVKPIGLTFFQQRCVFFFGESRKQLDR